MIIALPGSGSFTGAAYKPEISVLAALLGGESSIKWSPGFSLLAQATSDISQAHINTSHSTYSDAGLLHISISGTADHIRAASIKVANLLKSLASGNFSGDDFKKAVAAAKFKALDAGQNIGEGIELTGAGLVRGEKAYQIDEVGKSIQSVTEQQLKKVNPRIRRASMINLLISSALDSKLIISGESNGIGSWRFIRPAICGRNWVASIDPRPSR